MFKFFVRIFLTFLLLIFLLVIYLSIFGIKTDKFNKLINSQITKYDKRINVDLEKVYIKLNLGEASFSVNSQDINISILNEKQQLANVDILIGINSIFVSENKIKKIIINSQENKIDKLLKFIRAYKLNIPALYLENSVTEGKIIYDIIINYKNNKFSELNIAGKIINTELNILGKEKIKNINFKYKFNYQNQILNISNLKFKYQNIDFNSKNISANLNNNFIDINGDFNNNINSILASKLIGNNINNYLEENKTLSTKSIFKVRFNKKFKVKDYNLKTKIKIDHLKVNLKNLNLKKYIKNYGNKIYLRKGEIDLDINKQKKQIEININSKYTFKDKNIPSNLSFKYLKVDTLDKFEFYIDLTNYEIEVNDINFFKKANEQFYLNVTASKNKNIFYIEDLKLFNDKNIIKLNKFKFGKNFKITDFNSIEAKYYNKNNFINDILVKKQENEIQLISNQFDISSIIEDSLKRTKKTNFLNIFESLNSPVKMNIKLAKLDDEHQLKNLSGNIEIKKNKFVSSNLSGAYDSKNKFIYKRDKIDGKKITIIFSDLAKPFVKKFNFIKGFEDGKLDYTSTEINENLSKSELRIYDFKLQDMPALTKLLSLASLQGIADLATGQGIRFNEFDMFFENSENLITINEIYALGPAISILMEGYVEKNKLVSLRGTLVPATTINKSIAKIPLLGNILVGDKAGEGVFGVSFKIKGPPDDLDTRVNPIKTLAPRFITRTLEKIKKTK